MTDASGQKRKGLGRVALRLLLPFGAMRQTAGLLRKEAGRAADSAKLLKEMAEDLSRNEADELPGKEEVGFEAALSRPGAMSVPELYAIFLGRKRVALTCGLLLGLGAIGGLMANLSVGSSAGMFLSGASLLTSVSISLTMAFTAEFRLWQLRGRRLSVSERGGVKDFISEPGWWIGVVSPELRSGGRVL